MGRFVTRDTELDQKPYLYCEHDPVNNVDPSGHGLGKWIKGLIAGTVVRTIGTIVIGIGLITIGVGVAPAVIIGGIIAGAAGGVITAKIIGSDPITGGIIGGIGGGIGGGVINSDVAAVDKLLIEPIFFGPGI